MRKIVLTVIGFAFTLSLGFHDFNSVALNKGDGGGAPARRTTLTLVTQAEHQQIIKATAE